MRPPTLRGLALAAGLTSALEGTQATPQRAPFPAGFRTQEIATNGTTLHVRIGGRGPAVLLLHGFGESGDMWSELAAQLMANHKVIVPDLRGMGLSAHPASGYTKTAQANDMAGVLTALHVGTVDLVCHDIGNMVGYAFAALFPTRARRLVVIDAPLPGIAIWEEIERGHRQWHFSFYGPDEERLVAGRERIYLDRFWNEMSVDPKRVTDETRAHYAALYARPGAMHSAFEQFKAFDDDAVAFRALAQRKITIPVLALGGDASFGERQALVMRAVATDVTGGVIPHSGHWIMDENPAATISFVRDFLAR
jgi:pimeloyl-ACP methyl ester carboxylesterase